MVQAMITFYFAVKVGTRKEGSIRESETPKEGDSASQWEKELGKEHCVVKQGEQVFQRSDTRFKLKHPIRPAK